MSYQHIELDASPGGVAVVLLNRPDKHNAFNAQVVSELNDAFETLEGADHIRVVFLKGAGKSFSAGADLDWMRAAQDYSEGENEEDAFALAEMLRRLHSLPMLTCALVQGAAMGGGAGLVAACDTAVALRAAMFRFSEVRLGITPATISPYVIDAIGPRRARALFATGESFDGVAAEKMGLVHYTAEDEAELRVMMDHVAKLAFETAPVAVAEAKRLVRDVAGEEIDAGLSRKTAKRIAERRVSEEGREGLAAFLDKRKPRWID